MTNSSTKALKDVAEDDAVQKTQVEKVEEAEAKDGGTAPAVDPQMAALLKRVEELEVRIAQITFRAATAPRPATGTVLARPVTPGKDRQYRLARPYWDGKVKHPAGALLTFPENLAPAGSVLVE